MCPLALGASLAFRLFSGRSKKVSTKKARSFRRGAKGAPTREPKIFLARRPGRGVFTARWPAADCGSAHCKQAPAGAGPKSLPGLPRYGRREVRLHHHLGLFFSPPSFFSSSLSPHPARPHYLLLSRHLLSRFSLSFLLLSSLRFRDISNPSQCFLAALSAPLRYVYWPCFWQCGSKSATWRLSFNE